MDQDGDGEIKKWGRWSINNRYHLAGRDQQEAGDGRTCEHGGWEQPQCQRKGNEPSNAPRVFPG